MPEKRCEFGPLTVAYDERVLAPRGWTLLQSEWAAELSPALPAGPILELCAGVGHIGLAAAVLTGRALVQVERDAVAARFARRNAANAGVADVDVRVAAMEDTVAADESFPLLIADPPYLTSAEVARYPDDPRGAIDGGIDGLLYIRQCVAIAAAHLAPGGALLLQVRGERQARDVRALDVRSYDDERAVALLTAKEIERTVIG